MNVKSNQPHCLPIQKYAPNIIKYSEGMSDEEFCKSDITYDACILNVINIGEQVKSLSEAFKEKHQHIPLRKIIGLRNMAAHSYEGLGPSLLFQSIQNDIPLLPDQISKIIKLGDFD